MRSDGGDLRDTLFLRDDALVLTLTYDGTARLWDGGSGTMLATLRGHDRGMTTAIPLPDGRSILTGGGDSVRLWRLADEEPLVLAHGATSGPASANFSDDGTRVLGHAEEGPVRILEAASGRPLIAFTDDVGNTKGVALSPDGTRLLIPGLNGAARLWDTRTGAAADVLTEHDGDVTGAVMPVAIIARHIASRRDYGIVAILAGNRHPRSRARSSGRNRPFRSSMTVNAGDSPATGGCRSGHRIRTRRPS